jgi:hypothetical protein
MKGSEMETTKETQTVRKKDLKMAKNLGRMKVILKAWTWMEKNLVNSWVTM